MATGSYTQPMSLIYACSGAADVGAISDLAARRLAKEGDGKMSCLAGIGGRVPPLLEAARNASRMLAIDGCSQECARKCLEHAGFTGFSHVELETLGMPKGESPPTEERISKAAHAARTALKA